MHRYMYIDIYTIRLITMHICMYIHLCTYIYTCTCKKCNQNGYMCIYIYIYIYCYTYT